MALFFVLNIYTGKLTSVLTTPKYKFLVESLEDVIANEDIKPLILKGSPAYGDLAVCTIYFYTGLQRSVYLKIFIY